MKRLTRNYPGKDVEMLLVAAVIMQHAISSKTFLIDKRTTWADPFFDNLNQSVEDAFSNVLGIDNSKELREATKTLLSIQKNALSDLVELRVQLNVDFKNNPNYLKTMLQDLGFSAFYTAAKQKRDQEALIQLLYKFDKNLTITLKSDIISAGISSKLLDDIVGYAQTLRNANVTQETAKDLRKDISEDKVAELNTIYDNIIGVARIASVFFKNQPLEKAKFSYSANLKQLNAKPSKPLKPDTESDIVNS